MILSHTAFCFIPWQKTGNINLGLLAGSTHQQFGLSRKAGCSGRKRFSVFFTRRCVQPNHLRRHQYQLRPSEKQSGTVLMSILLVNCRSSLFLLMQLSKRQSEAYLDGECSTCKVQVPVHLYIQMFYRYRYSRLNKYLQYAYVVVRTFYLAPGIPCTGTWTSTDGHDAIQYI